MEWPVNKPKPQPAPTLRPKKPANKPALSEDNLGILEAFGNVAALKAEVRSTLENATSQPHMLPVTALIPLPGQPRRLFAQGPLDALTASVRERGILTPLLVREMPEAPHQIVAGERRWRAAQAAGLTEVPVALMQLSEREALEVALTENLQRSDLSVIDRTDATARLIALTLNVPLEQIAARLHALRKRPDEPGHAQEIDKLDGLFRQLGGRWTSFLANHLPILSWPADVLEAVRAGLEYSKAALIARVPDAARRAELVQLAQGGSSLTDLRSAITANAAPLAPTRATQVRTAQQALKNWKKIDTLPATQQKRFESLLQELNDLLG